MGDKHAMKGASLRKQGHEQQDQKLAAAKAAKKLAMEAADAPTAAGGKGKEKSSGRTEKLRK